MTYKEDEYDIEAKTNDNFRLSVSTEYDISSASPKFKIQKSTDEVIDLSSHITKTDINTFLIDVNASVLEDIGELKGKRKYDCVLDFGNGSKEFLFGGCITITNGVS